MFHRLGRGSKDDSQHTSQLWRMSGMGTELAGAIIGMTLVGYLLDRWLGTLPWCTVGGAMLGILGGGYNFLKDAMRVTRETAKQYRAEHPPQSPGDAMAAARRGAPGATPVDPPADLEEEPDDWDRRWEEKWGDGPTGTGGGGGSGDDDDR